MSDQVLGFVALAVIMLLLFVVAYLHQISRQLDRLRDLVGRSNQIADEARRGIRDSWGDDL